MRDLGGASTPKSWLHSHPLLLPPSRRPFRGPGHSARIAKRPCCFGQYGRPIVTHPTFVVAPVARMARQSKMCHNKFCRERRILLRYHGFLITAEKLASAWLLKAHLLLAHAPVAKVYLL